MDIIFLLNYLKGIGPNPAAFAAGDGNGDCQIDVQDISYLVNYLEGRGPEPRDGGCR